MSVDTLSAVLANQYLFWWAAQVVALIILVILVVRWKPGFLKGRTIGTTMNAALDARAQQIQVQLEAAERSRQEAARIRAESAAEVEKARADAHDIVQRAAQTSEAIREELEKRSRDEYQRILGQARSEIEYERQQAEAALQRRAADIVIDAAGQIIKQNLETQTDRQLIETSLTEMRNGR